MRLALLSSQLPSLLNQQGMGWLLCLLLLGTKRVILLQSHAVTIDCGTALSCTGSYLECQGDSHYFRKWGSQFLTPPFPQNSLSSKEKADSEVHCANVGCE